MLEGARRPWTGPAELRAVVERGLEEEPERQIVLENLIDALRT